MPDISMCRGEGCPIKSTCFRHMAQPNPYWQSYAALENVCNEETNFNRWMCLICVKEDRPVCDHVDLIKGDPETYGGTKQYFPGLIGKVLVQGIKV